MIDMIDNALGNEVLIVDPNSHVLHKLDPPEKDSPEWIVSYEYDNSEICTRFWLDTVPPDYWPIVGKGARVENVSG